MMAKIILESKFHFYFPLEEDEDMYVNHGINFFSMVTGIFIYATGLNVLLALVPDSNRTYGQRFRSRLPKVVIVVTLFLLLSYVAQIFGLATWAN